jgi:hypothetical protein
MVARARSNSHAAAANLKHNMIQGEEPRDEIIVEVPNGLTDEE